MPEALREAVDAALALRRDGHVSLELHKIALRLKACAADFAGVLADCRALEKAGMADYKVRLRVRGS